MDPLVAHEYSAAVTALKREGYVDPRSRYPLITLEELTKAEVLEWKPADSLPRRAFVIVKKGPQTFEAVVDVARSKVVSWKQVKGVQPGVLLTEEFTSAQQIVRANRKWRAAVRKRGIDNLQAVVCVPLTVGYYGTPEEEGRRLAKVACFDSRGTKNFWGRPRPQSPSGH